MLRNFCQDLLDLDGEPLKDPAGVTVTLQNASVNALLANDQNENPDGVEKAKRFALAMKIHNVKEPVDVTAEEIALVKKLIGKVYTALVVGRAYELLEQKIEEVKSAV